MRAARLILWIPAALSIALPGVPLQAGNQTGGWSQISGSGSRHSGGRQESLYDSRGYDHPSGHQVPRRSQDPGYWGDWPRSPQGERCGGGDRRDQSRERRRR